jgi:NitT/TauT family transport system permease protein
MTTTNELSGGPAARKDAPGRDRSLLKILKPGHGNLRFYQVLVLLAFFLLWHAVTRDPQAAFFFGEPVKVLTRIWNWFTTGSGSLAVGIGDTTWFTLDFPAEIYPHLLVTLTETLLAFAIGTALGMAAGLWLALSPVTSAIFDPYIKAANSMPRVILAPIFGMWFGLGIWSKVALAVTLVFFIVFFNVYQGVKEVSPAVLANARMLGASQRQLLRDVYLPSATSWVFSSLHTSVGLAFVGAIVGEYLGSARGVGYLILQAEGSFDVNTVFAGILVLTAFALVLDGLVGLIERRLMKWQPRSGETERI